MVIEVYNKKKYFDFSKKDYDAPLCPVVEITGIPKL